MSRSSTTTRITGSAKKVKRNIKSFLNENNVKFLIQKIISSEQPSETILFMEMETERLVQIKSDLIQRLGMLYPTPSEVLLGEWEDMVSDSPLIESKIGPTIGSLSKESSGYEESLSGEGII